MIYLKQNWSVNKASKEATIVYGMFLDVSIIYKSRSKV